MYYADELILLSAPLNSLQALLNCCRTVTSVENFLCYISTCIAIEWNGVIAKTVLCDLDLLFDGQTFKILISRKR